MKSSDQRYFASLAYDLRVRERLLAAGVITQADIERYMTDLPELETHAEGLGVAQPALASSSGAAQASAVSSAAASAADEDADGADEAGEA